jgi:hypothetical protein
VKEMTVMNLIISRKRVTVYNSIPGSQNNSAFQKELSALELPPGFSPPFYNECISI